MAGDGGGADLPYTAALVAAIRQPGLDVFHVFNEVGLSVKTATGGQQQPWLASSPVSGNFYFFAGPVSVTNQQMSDEAVFWQSVSASRNPGDLQAYLRRYPNGAFVELARARLAALSTPQAPALTGGGGGRSRFDGTWDVVLVCDRARDGANGYTKRFGATVQNGMFRGGYGVSGQADRW